MALGLRSGLPQCDLPGFIFTFAPEKTVRPGFVGQAVEVVEKGGGSVDFVELICPLAELKRRIDSPSRLEYQKLSSLALFEKLYAEGVLDGSHMPKPGVTVDTSLCSPIEADDKDWRRSGTAGVRQHLDSEYEESAMREATRVVRSTLTPAAAGREMHQGPVFAAPFHTPGDPAGMAYTYARSHNPTWTELEGALAAMEWGRV